MMNVNEAYQAVVNELNENFKVGAYDINEANSIISALTIISKALQVQKPSDKKEVESVVEEVAQEEV